MSDCLRFRSIALMLVLVAFTCSAPASNAAAAAQAASPGTLSAVQASDTSSLQLVGSLGGNAARVQVDGTRAYVGGAASLRIVDISKPASPSVLGSYPFDVTDLQVVGNIAYLAGTAGLQIVDITTAGHPVARGSFQFPIDSSVISQGARRIHVVGNIAFAIFEQIINAIPPYRSQLAMIDVRDRNHPALIGSYDLRASFNDLVISNGYAYVGGTIDVGGATGRFFNAYLRILDIHDPAHPAAVGKYQNTQVFVPPSRGGLAVVGDLAYLGIGSDTSLYTLDIHDRTQPTPFGSLAITADDLRVVGLFAYVAERNVGLTIADIRDPAAPARRASYPIQDILRGIDVAGDYIYLAAGDSGLRILRFLPRTTALVPAAGGTLEATVGRVSYQFPAGAFADTAVVTHTLRIANDLPPAPAHIRIGPAFEITASYSATGQLAQPALPISITVGYTNAERGAAVADTPALYYWDGSTWVKESSSVLDQSSRSVTAVSTRLGMWALLGDARRAALPILRR